MTTSSDDPHLPEPTSSVALYEGPRLALFRGWALVALVAASVAVGAVTVPLITPWVEQMHAQAIRWLRNESNDPHDSTRAPAGVDGTLRSARFTTTTGERMALPLGRPLVVNVWLQSCQDCMRAFQAWHDIVEQKRLAPQLASASASVYNVAWGSADAAFAGRYHVDDNLLFDSGDALVKPLQITSFTTFVLDKDLRVRMRERPDSVGFAERLAGALQILGLDAAPAP